MSRKLFCEISPTTYKISRQKNILQRKISDTFSAQHFAKEKSSEPLPILIYKHKSLIRRVLGNVDLQLQENKAHNLALATPNLNGILIKPNEIFSFWRLLGNANAGKGYREGLTISNGAPSSGIGGGMCQFTNLIHWMILHTPLTIIEHHHHDALDLFPDYNRQIPFGTGTSIAYNYLDYRFKNTTQNTYQLICYTDDKYLCGELRALYPQEYTYHIKAENEYFSKENAIVYRNGEVYRYTINPSNGNALSKELLRTNHARVMYDTSQLEIVDSK